MPGFLILLHCFSDTETEAQKGSVTGTKGQSECGPDPFPSKVQVFNQGATRQPTPYTGCPVSRLLDGRTGGGVGLRDLLLQAPPSSNEQSEWGQAPRFSYGHQARAGTLSTLVPPAVP